MSINKKEIFQKKRKSYTMIILRLLIMIFINAFKTDDLFEHFLLNNENIYRKVH